jgi:predicted DCC family thiol-disulfide oxidoreductase YuxK
MSLPPELIVVFDGTCSFCTGSVKFILRHDKRGRFRFASRQSVAGRALCAQHALNPDQLGSVVLIGPAGPRLHSDAVLGIAVGFGGAWRLLSVAQVIPRAVRDWLYQVLARNRHRWFGTRSTCYVPGPDIRQRFLE